MKIYLAVVHKEEGSTHGISFPDLPGCFSAADDLSSLVPNAREALDLWFEDADEVEPSNIEAILEDVSEDLAAGAFLIAVPRVTRLNRSVRVNVSLDRGILDAIDTAAAARKLTRSEFLAEAARNEIELSR